MDFVEEIRLLILSIGVVLWFRAIYHIIARYVPSELKYDILLLIISLIIFYVLHGSIEILLQ